MADKGVNLFDERATESVHLYHLEEECTVLFVGTVKCIHLAP